LRAAVEGAANNLECTQESCELCAIRETDAVCIVAQLPHGATLQYG
jgi:hypothetical protein